MDILSIKGADGQWHGIPAIQGPKGDKGDKGDQGIQGPQGIQGETGPQGPKGNDGTMTFEDLTPEQKASLKGDKGDKGDPGIQGPKGDKGDTGAQGLQGIQGVKGDKGDTGAKGDKGDKGEQGIQGNPGADGKTPVKGTDYWTAADKKEMTDYIDTYFGDVNAALEQIIVGNQAQLAVALDAENDALIIEEPVCATATGNTLIINDKTAEVIK